MNSDARIGTTIKDSLCSWVVAMNKSQSVNDFTQTPINDEKGRRRTHFHSVDEFLGGRDGRKIAKQVHIDRG